MRSNTTAIDSSCERPKIACACFTRRGYDWSDRYPRIVAAAKRIKGAFLIDGEAVVSDERGIANFERLHSREHDKSATLWAFDLLELNGEDLRQLPLDERKAKLAKLLKGSRHSGIALNEHLEADGERAFWDACKIGFEGIVSKPIRVRPEQGLGEGQESESARRPAVSESGGIVAAANRHEGHRWRPTSERSDRQQIDDGRFRGNNRLVTMAARSLLTQSRHSALRFSALHNDR